MPVKPSENEEEYFAREEMERRKKAAAEREAGLLLEEREKARNLHHMKCPKCGMQLEEIPFAGILVDKCFHCGGIWLDEGEIGKISSKEQGFFHRLAGVLHR